MRPAYAAAPMPAPSSPNDPPAGRPPSRRWLRWLIVPLLVLAAPLGFVLWLWLTSDPIRYAAVPLPPEWASDGDFRGEAPRCHLPSTRRPRLG